MRSSHLSSSIPSATSKHAHHCTHHPAPPTPPTWQNMWQGGRAMSLRAAGFQADRTRRRSFGSVLILWISSASCRGSRAGRGRRKPHQQAMARNVMPRQQDRPTGQGMARNSSSGHHTTIHNAEQ